MYNANDNKCLVFMFECLVLRYVVFSVKMYPRSCGAAGRYRLALLVPATGGGGGSTGSQSQPCDHNTSPQSSHHIGDRLPTITSYTARLDIIITAISHLHTPHLLLSYQLAGSWESFQQFAVLLRVRWSLSFKDILFLSVCCKSKIFALLLM